VFILLAAGVSALIHARVLTLPYLISFPFLAIGMAMAFELGYDLFRAAQLAERLQVSEAAVREREARISLAAESANLALWVYDPQEDVTWLSDKGREIFGFTPNERLSADSFRSRIHPDERDLVMSAFQGAQTSPDGFELEHRVVRSEQDTRWVIVRGRSLRDEAGKLLELIGVTIDITAQKKADLENQTHRQEMAHLSRVAVMGEMAGSLAHELNQPLLAIASNASSARRFLERGELERGLLLELLQDISADSQRAGEVIRSVRGFVRKGDGRSELIDLNETVANVARLMRSDLLMRESMVLTELDPKLPMIEGIAVHIQQVLLNLILNALDAMQTLPATKRRVTITTRTVNETKIEVSVRDSGTGLPADKLEKIFEHFYSTKREGMGMGLTIARSIIAAHGGMLEAENAEGGGARFFFRIPVAQEKNS
ncbi:MAG TPA: ATP-binding protein, partial [Chthoniobacterales bacterium]|nr:ATP-binding protein [Chthoniobacterales bacterium]